MGKVTLAASSGGLTTGHSHSHNLTHLLGTRVTVLSHSRLWAVEGHLDQLYVPLLHVSGDFFKEYYTAHTLDLIYNKLLGLERQNQNSVKEVGDSCDGPCRLCT